MWKWHMKAEAKEVLQKSLPGEYQLGGACKEGEAWQVAFALSNLSVSRSKSKSKQALRYLLQPKAMDVDMWAVVAEGL